MKRAVSDLLCDNIAVGWVQSPPASELYTASLPSTQGCSDLLLRAWELAGAENILYSGHIRAPSSVIPPLMPPLMFL